MIEPFNPAFFRRLQQLKIRTRRAFLGSRQGSHISLQRGHGLEFADYRPYSPGDDFRHIDWGIYGRTDRLYVRQFRSERDINVVMLVDSSRSMGFPAGEGKFEMARDLALSLGYSALADGDSVSFVMLGARKTPHYVGPRAIRTAITELGKVRPDYSFDLLDATRAAISEQRIPARCFFLSDFLVPEESYSSALDLLQNKNFEVSVVQVLAPGEQSLEEDTGIEIAVDAETGEEIAVNIDSAALRDYELALGRHNLGLERYCARSGISYVLVSSGELITDVVLTKFPKAGLLR